MADRATLREAVTTAIQDGGFEILNAPERFVGSVMDLIDNDSVEASILYNYCNTQFLGWFVQSDTSEAKADLKAASAAAEQYLVRQHGIDRTVAHDVAWAIALGIAAVRGEQLEGSSSSGVTNGFRGSGRGGGTVMVNGGVNPTHSHGGQNGTQPGHTGNPGWTDGSGHAGTSGYKGGITGQIPPVPEEREVPHGMPAWLKAIGVMALTLLVCLGLVVGYQLLTGSDVPYVWPDNSTSQEPTKLVKPTLVDKSFRTTADGLKALFLTARNESASTVDLHAAITFVDDNGNVLEEKECNAWSVGPGETTLLEQYSNVVGVAKASFNVTSMAPRYGKTSLLSCVSIEELTLNDNGFTVCVTNTSNKDVKMVSCVGYGYDDSDHFVYIPVAYDENERTLKSGEKRNVVFEGSEWKAYTRKVYVYGYAD